MSERVYRVVITREDDAWLAEVPGLAGAHTYARTLSGLERAVREVIVLAADLPDEAMADVRLDNDFQTGDPAIDTAAREVRARRAEAERLAAVAAGATVDVARQLIEQGFSVRDTASVLGISPQRVSQLTQVRKAS